MRHSLWLPLAAVFLVAACSSDPESQIDAGVDGDADADFEVALPVLTPCPGGWVEVPPDEEDGVTTCDPWPESSPLATAPCTSGWRQVEDDGVATCDPWPEGGSRSCAVEEAHFPGGPTCSRIGTDCPTGDWAEDLPVDGSIFYVAAGAPAGGDGTRESPFGTIGEATDAAEEGTVIALSKGTFDEAVTLRNGVALWGACVAETVVACTSPSSDAGTVDVEGRNAVLRNLQLGGRRAGVTVLGSSFSVHLEDVLILRARIAGLAIVNGSMTARGLVVRETQGLETNGQYGLGVQVSGGARVELSRTVFARNWDVGVLVGGAGTTLTLEDVVVRATQHQERDVYGGRGLVAEDGAQVTAVRAVFEENGYASLFVLDSGTMLVLTDALVRETRTAADGKGGIGLAVGAGAQAELSRVVFERNRNMALLSSHRGTLLNISDSVVRDTVGRDLDGQFGSGLVASEESQVVVKRTVFDRNRLLGVLGVGAGTMLTLEDVLVRNTLGQMNDGVGGHGLHLVQGAQADVRRLLIDRNREGGVVVFGPSTTLNMSDVVVRDTRGSESTGLAGHGLTVSSGARVEVSRAFFERNREVGVSAFGTPTLLTMSDVLATDTREVECTEEDCASFGDGVASVDGASIDITGFSVSRHARCGVTVRGAAMDLHDGEVSENTIGACVNAEDFDPDRLLDGVFFRDNGIRLDPNFDMPVPEPALPLEWE